MRVVERPSVPSHRKGSPLRKLTGLGFPERSRVAPWWWCASEPQACYKSITPEYSMGKNDKVWRTFVVSIKRVAGLGVDGTLPKHGKGRGLSTWRLLDASSQDIELSPPATTRTFTVQLLEAVPPSGTSVFCTWCFYKNNIYWTFFLTLKGILVHCNSGKQQPKKSIKERISVPQSRERQEPFYVVSVHCLGYTVMQSCALLVSLKVFQSQ